MTTGWRLYPLFDVASNLTIALIAGGAVLGGATLGGAAQVVVSWRQRRHEREERRRSLRLTTYRALLHHFAGMVSLINEGIIQDDAGAAALLRKWTADYDLLRADVVLVGPAHVRELADEVQEAFGRMADSGDAEARREGEGADAWTRRRFEEHVWPAIKRLADTMAADIDLR